jgi:phosphatidylserine decarboxylase
MIGRLMPLIQDSISGKNQMRKYFHAFCLNVFPRFRSVKTRRLSASCLVDPLSIVHAVQNEDVAHTKSIICSFEEAKNIAVTYGKELDIGVNCR